MKVSLILSCFNRSELLAFGIDSISRQLKPFDFEVVVVNDGMENDGTMDVCKSYKDRLNIKYIFAGFRNQNSVIPRNPSFPNNIGVRQSSGDLIILSCPEIYHLNNAIELLIEPLINRKNILSIPSNMFWDVDGCILRKLINGELVSTKGMHGDVCHTKLPFFMGMWKDEFISIGGYDEDFTGYAAEDEDLVNRFLTKGFLFHETDSQIIHLFHGRRCSSPPYWDNPAWVHNYSLFKARFGTVKRNIGKEWGII